MKFKSGHPFAEDEREILSRLRPALVLRGVWMVVAFAAFAVFNHFYNLVGPATLIFAGAVIVAVNFLTYVFIKREYPIVAFSSMNAAFFIALLTLIVYHTGGDRSIFVVSYIVIVVIISTFTSSLPATIIAIALVLVSFNTIMLMSLNGMLEQKPFHLALVFSVNDESNPIYTLIFWNIFYVGLGIICGYLSSIIGSVRKELRAVNNENIRLQEIIKSMVSKTTWSEASEAARREAEKLDEHFEERTILFSDIVGFSSIAENVPPEKLIAMLNEHFRAMGEIIHRRGGDIEKFIGDSIMAVFAEAEAAVEAALEMQSAATADALKSPETGFNIRIGINTGKVIFGNMGTPDRMDHTLIGDPVNIAQRLESIAEPGTVLISESTYTGISSLQSNFGLVGPVEIKGKKEKVQVYSYTAKGG